MTHFEKENDSEDQTVTKHKTSEIHKKKSKKSKIDYWKISTVVLIVLLAITIFNNGFKFNGSSMSKDDVANKAISFVNNQLLAGRGTASLQSVTEDNELYNLKINVNGQEIDSYATKDGQLFFPQAINLNEWIPVPTAEANPSAPTPSTTEIDMEAVIDDDNVKGDPAAPITIVEFSDYECPFCTRFYEQTLQQLEEKYIDTGKVKFVYRDFPLSFHQNAQKAAEAAECAGEQDKYYEMHDLLFEKGVSGGVSNFKQYAQEIGLDTNKFDECLDSGSMASEVRKDFSDGQQLGVSGTPAFFINGKSISGAQPFSVFESEIKQILGD